jgi:5,10-methylenetetrahydrofolate reductase
MTKIRLRRYRFSSGPPPAERRSRHRSGGHTNSGPRRGRTYSSAGSLSPERHARTRNEHLRLVAKQTAGCSFFVTQVVYDVNAAKDLVSDYRYECAAHGLEAVPIVFTFSVCGSVKTLEFLQWLGVDVPRWIENDLRHADDTLDASYHQAVDTAVELIAFCRRVGVPFGLNVESVSIRKVEIEASVRLAARLRAELGR